MSNMPVTVTSSPGKVLLAGGYLILEPEYFGLVVATSSRFYTVVRDDIDVIKTTNNNDVPYKITVRSPQFQNASWTYSIMYLANSTCQLTSLQNR